MTIESKTSGERYPLPSVSSFSYLPSTLQYLDKNTYYEFHSEITSEYVWMYLNHGKSSPRNAELTNVQTGEKTPNLRTIDEAELTKQTFALYSFKTNLLYLSNLRLRGVLETILKTQLNTNVNITSCFVNEEDFIARLREVESISFSHAYNLFSQDSTKRQALIDLTGVAAPENFSIEAKYKAHTITNFIRQLISARKKQEISGMIIRGRDENQFAIVYNSETFTRKVEISASMNADSYMFDEKEVQERIIDFVRHEGI